MCSIVYSIIVPKHKEGGGMRAEWAVKCLRAVAPAGGEWCIEKEGEGEGCGGFGGGGSGVPRRRSGG